MAVSLPVLPFLSIHPESQPTILLIHGAFSNKETWKPVHALLSQYHLLIPTLPEHQEAASTPGIGKLTLANTSTLLSQLVAAQAHNGRVHVVGHSFGANIALHFASHYPEQVTTVFVSGTAGFISSRFTPYALWVDGIVTAAVPKRLIEYLTDMDPELSTHETFGGIRSMSLCKAISEILMIPVEGGELIPESARGELSRRGIRVLAVAATKRGVLPTDDNLDRAIAVAERLGGTAVEVPTMRHAWYYQDAGLFARLVIAWVEGGDLPVEVIRASK